MAVLELARYRLLASTDTTALLDVERSIQQEVGPRHPGYLGRELLQAADGSYVLLMRWEDEHAATTWNATLFASEAGRRLGSLVDPSSMSIERLVALAV